MIDYLNIPGSSLARDMNSLGLVETDKKKIDEHKHKKLMATTATEQQKMKQDVDLLLNDVAEIKTTLTALLKLLENKG